MQKLIMFMLDSRIYMKKYLYAYLVLTHLWGGEEESFNVLELYRKQAGRESGNKQSLNSNG